MEIKSYLNLPVSCSFVCLHCAISLERWEGKPLAGTYWAVRRTVRSEWFLTGITVDDGCLIFTVGFTCADTEPRTVTDMLLQSGNISIVVLCVFLLSQCVRFSGCYSIKHATSLWLCTITATATCEHLYKRSEVVLSVALGTWAVRVFCLLPPSKTE